MKLHAGKGFTSMVLIVELLSSLASGNVWLTCSCGWLTPFSICQFPLSEHFCFNTELHKINHLSLDNTVQKIVNFSHGLPSGTYTLQVPM